MVIRGKEQKKEEREVYWSKGLKGGKATQNEEKRIIVYRRGKKTKDKKIRSTEKGWWREVHRKKGYKGVIQK